MTFSKKLNSSIEDFLREAIPIINKESERIWHKVNDVTVFEQRCFQQLTSTFENDNFQIDSNQAIIHKVVKRVAAFCIKRTKKESIVSLESLAGQENETDKRSFQPEDVLANVQEKVLVKEKVALLAKGDNRKRLILKSWLIDGCMCDTEISGLLADKLGGKKKSHLRYIQRFKNECKLALAS